MHEPVHATEIDERPERDDRRHDTPPDLAGLQVVEELLTLLLLGLLQPRPPGQHHVVSVLVQLDDLGLDGGADEGLQITHPPQVHQRRRQEAAQTDVHDEPALDDLDDRAGDDSTGGLDLFDIAPGPLVLSALLGEDEAPLLVLLLQHEGLDLLVEGHDFAGMCVVADGELAGGDDPLGLEADVDEDLVVVDPHHVARDHRAFLDRHDAAGVGGGQLLLVEVVHGDFPRLDKLGHFIAGGARECFC